jgi:hypothetical protein
VLLWLREHSEGVRLLRGKDGKEGWLSSIWAPVLTTGPVAAARTW